MNKLVYTVFKTLMVSMIFVFVFDMACYLYKALSLNQRMESIMTSMQRVVMENNYLPQDSYNMYISLLTQLVNDMNGQKSANVAKHDGSLSWFVDWVDLNYDNAAVGAINTLTAKKYDPVKKTTDIVNILVPKMNLPAAFGDIMVVQARVCIEQPSWIMKAGQSSAEAWGKQANGTMVLTYTYYVPCLKYQSVSQ